MLASDEAKGGVQMARRNSEEREGDGQEYIQQSYGENGETKTTFLWKGKGLLSLGLATSSSMRGSP